jgi:hypothetical protein
MPPWPAISVISLLVSVASFVTTLVSNSIQNSRWNALNQPRFDLAMDPYFTAFEELDTEEANSRDWGYSPWLAHVQLNGVRTKTMHRLSELVWVRRETPLMPAFPGPGAGTVREAAAEIIKRRLNTRDLLLKKHLQAHFAFRNNGSLPARETRAQVELKWVLDADVIEWLKQRQIGPANGQWETVVPMTLSDRADIAAGQSISRDVDLYLLFELPAPKQVWFRITYKWREQQHQSAMTLYFDFNQDAWCFGPST